MRTLIATSALAAAGLMATEAGAQANPNQQVANRKGAMNLQAKFAGPLFAMARGAAPYDARIVQRNADYLVALAQMPWEDFQPNSIGIPNTRTKDTVLKNAEKFKQLATALQSDAQKVAAAARGGDQNSVKSAVQAMGRTCNSCHEGFADFEFRFRLE
jgi:cytochrome c556